MAYLANADVYHCAHIAHLYDWHVCPFNKLHVLDPKYVNCFCAPDLLISILLKVVNLFLD